MDPSFPALELACLAGIIVGIVGVVVPVLPGLLLCWGSVLAWVLLADPAGTGWGRWLILGLVTVWTLLGAVIKYAWPGKRMKAAGIPTRTLVAGVVGALLGMVFLPLVGLPLGFVAGVWAAEWARFGNAAAAWPSTRQAVLGAGLAVLIELTAAALILATYLGGLWLA